MGGSLGPSSEFESFTLPKRPQVPHVNFSAVAKNRAFEPTPQKAAVFPPYLFVVVDANSMLLDIPGRYQFNNSVCQGPACIGPVSQFVATDLMWARVANIALIPCIVTWCHRRRPLRRWINRKQLKDVLGSW